MALAGVIVTKSRPLSGLHLWLQPQNIAYLCNILAWQMLEWCTCILIEIWQFTCTDDVFVALIVNLWKFGLHVVWHVSLLILVQKDILNSNKSLEMFDLKLLESGHDSLQCHVKTYFNGMWWTKLFIKACVQLYLSVEQTCFQLYVSDEQSYVHLYTMYKGIEWSE